MSAKTTVLIIFVLTIMAMVLLVPAMMACESKGGVFVIQAGQCFPKGTQVNVFVGGVR